MEATMGEQPVDGCEDRSETMAIVPVGSPSCIQAKSIGRSVLTRNSTPTQAADVPVFNQERTLMPVNIKQIADAWLVRQAGFIVINNAISPSLKIIGRVVGKIVDEFKGTFKIDDGTGVINGSIWFTCGREELDQIPEGSYAMTVGKIRMDGQNPELLCYVCRPVTNFNDITHHHLSVIATHIDLVLKPTKTVHAMVAEMWKADKDASAQQAATSVTASSKKPKSTLFLLNNDVVSSVCEVRCKEELNCESSDGVQTSDAIMRILREKSKSAGPEGVHIDLVCSILMTNKEALRHYIDDLALAGELYTTVDCDHLAPT